MISIAMYGNERELNLHENEIHFVNLVFDLLKDSVVQTDKLGIVRKSDSYATIVILGEEWDYDLIRFKITDKTKWLSIALSNDDRVLHQNNLLFEAQKKKTQLHWKSKIHSIDELPKYKDFIINSYLQCLEIHRDNFE